MIFAVARGFFRVALALALGATALFFVVAAAEGNVAAMVFALGVGGGATVLAAFGLVLFELQRDVARGVELLERRRSVR